MTDAKAPADRPGRLAAPLLGAASLGIALVVLFFHARRYSGYIADDALISLRYAERLLEGGGLTWNDGEWVEGYSNLLWVLASALLGALGIDLVDATRVLAVLGFGAAMAALVYLHAPQRPAEMGPALFGASAMALTGSFAIWTVGGLEQPMVAGLLAWALVLTLPLLRSGDASTPPPSPGQLLAPGLLYGLLCLTRPDAPLFVGCASLALLLVGRLRSIAFRSALWLALPSLVLIVIHTAGRLLYYGDYIPNTAHAKVAFSIQRLTAGWHYWYGGVSALAPLALAAAAYLGVALFVGNARTARPRALLLALPLLVWSGWVMAIGGDNFPGRRHLVVVVVLMAFAAAGLVQWLQDRLSLRAPAWRVTGVAVGLACLVLLGWMQWTKDRNHNRTMMSVQWARRGEALGKLFGAGFAREQPLLAVTAAGAIPYYSRLPALDMLGLSDRYLAMNPPENLGHGRIGHELGDGRYFMRREPDLVVFCGTRGRVKACSRGGREMQADPRFDQRYTLARFFATDPQEMVGEVYVRIHSPRIGIRPLPDEGGILIPPLVFAAQPGSLLVLNDDASFSLRMVPEATAQLRALPIQSGHWTLHAWASGPARITLRDVLTGRVLASGAASFPIPVHVKRDTEVEIGVESAAQTVLLHGIVLRRGGREAASQQPLPDVVMVMLDTLRPDRLEIFGYGRELSPFLAELREASTLFLRAYSTSSCTPPAVASLFTGVYPRRHGVLEVIYAPRKLRIKSMQLGVPYDDIPINALPAALDVLPELLRREGYRTFGVSSNPNVSRKMGFDRGFDYFERVGGAAPGAEEVLDAVRQLGAELVNASPRFVYVHFMDPHFPYRVRDPSVPLAELPSGAGLPASDNYDREVRYLDRHLRELVSLLELRRNSIVIFTSDHGEELRERGELGHGFGLHAELNRALIMIHVPFLADPPRAVDRNVSLIDVLPTIMEAIGRPVAGVDGESLWPLLAGTPSESAALDTVLQERTLLAHRRRRVAGKPPDEAWSALHGDWRLIEERRGEAAPTRRLYDHAGDIAEMNDRGAEHPEVMARLQARIDAHRSEPVHVFEKRRIELSEEEAAELEAIGYIDP